MDTTSKIAIFSIIASFIGIILGWILKETSNKLEEYQNNKKQYRKVLFYLLRIRTFIIEGYRDEIKDGIAENSSDGINEEDKPKAKEVTRWILDQIDEEFISKKTSGEIDELRIKFKETIEILSEIRPLIAFDLLENSNIPDYFIDFNEMTERFKKQHNPDEVEKFLMDIKENLSEKRLEDSVESLENAILFVAKIVGKKTYKHLEEVFEEYHELDYLFKEKKETRILGEDELPF